MQTIPDKTFDCVKTVRKERDRIAKDTDGKSAKEILKYFNDRKEKAEIVRNDKK